LQERRDALGGSREQPRSRSANPRRVVATRPTDVNGLGWSPAFTRTSIDGFLGQFRLLAETRDAFDQWLALVTTEKVAGKRAHDVRIAAVMLASGVTELVTLNTDDFQKIPGLVVQHPATVTA
jgi:hypothetical protein